MAAEPLGKRLGGIIPFLLGGASFLVFYLALQVGAPAAFLAAAVSIAGGFFLFAPARRPPLLDAAGISPDMFEETLRDGRDKRERIRTAAARIADPRIRDKVLGIGGTVEKILEEARKDPQGIKLARQFLSYYLDATLKIVEKYNDMSAAGAALPAVRKTLEKTESMLDLIDGAFRRQLTKLLEHDVMDLDAELALLDKTIRMEGWGGGRTDEK